jgi:hypothetical protein
LDGQTFAERALRLTPVPVSGLKYAVSPLNGLAQIRLAASRRARPRQNLSEDDPRSREINMRLVQDALLDSDGAFYLFFCPAVIAAQVMNLREDGERPGGECVNLADGVAVNV